jgi:hypothetical protein
MTVDETFPCPACGFLMFSEAPGSYEICDLCGWEDDHVQLAHPGTGGANAESLIEAQVIALRKLPLEIRRASDFDRDPLWRPLEEGDLQTEVAAPTTGIEYFHAAAEDAAEYWRVRPARAVEALVKEVDARAPGCEEFRLWVPARLSLQASEVPMDLAMAVVVDRLLAHGLFPDGFEEVPGGRVYRYRRGG